MQTDLSARIRELAPWHLDVAVSPDVTTAVGATARPLEPHEGRVSFIRPRQGFVDLVTRIFPDGLQGRSALDCACNCGGYLFWLKELGAGDAYGFDVREHWIRQARFLAEHRDPWFPGSRDIRFATHDLYDLPRHVDRTFSMTIFKGIFYHLPDPVTGLKLAADRTDELLLLNTATRTGYADEVLVLAEESREHLMSGVHGLNWFPSGPVVLARILRWMGFRDVRCTYHQTQGDTGQPPGLGRLELLAARSADTLAALPETWKV